MSASIGFRPSSGIDHILGPREGPGTAALPAVGRVLPSEAVTGAASLDRLYASAWDQAMRDFLRPRVHTRELLIPGVFADRIAEARQRLADQARTTHSRRFRAAVDVLDADGELRTMLESARNLLLPG